MAASARVVRPLSGSAPGSLAARDWCDQSQGSPGIRPPNRRLPSFKLSRAVTPCGRRSTSASTPELAPAGNGTAPRLNVVAKVAVTVLHAKAHTVRQSEFHAAAERG